MFSAKLLAAVGGDERAAYNGSQDYDLYLRLNEKAHKIVHIPHLLYYWRSSPTSAVSYTHLFRRKHVDCFRAERAADGWKTALPNLRRFVRHSTASDEEMCIRDRP